MRYDVRKVIRMLYRLQRHGLPIKAHFRSSLVLAYAVPAPLLRPLLPTGLVLDTYGDFGFLAIALDDRYRTRVPSLPHSFDADYGMGFLFIVECERERSCKFAGFCEICEGRSRGRGDGLSGQVRLNVKISPTVLCTYLDLVPLLGALHSEARALVMVLG